MEETSMRRILDSYSKSILRCALAVGLLVAPRGAKAAAFEVLYTFQGGNDGGVPRGGVVADKAGNLYGTAGGGIEQSGIVFKLAPDGTQTVLHAFAGGDGYGPDGLIADKVGNFYGTTGGGGGKNFYGTVFKMAPDGNETLRYDFKGHGDGRLPYAGVILENGNLYGTTLYGGDACGRRTGCGTVFKVAPDGTETVLHAFYRHHSDGRWPYAGLVADSAGNLYGTTVEGGIACGRPVGCGTVFKLAPDGTETVLYAFRKAHGEGPSANLILDSAGNLYGTTSRGGTHDGGTVFKLAPDGTETVLYNFCSQTNCSDGGYPDSALIADKAGNFYGTASAGGQAGSVCSGGCGTVFQLSPEGTYTVLYTFTGGRDGADPVAGLLLRKGYLYGAASEGGAVVSELICEFGCGTVFRVKL